MRVDGAAPRGLWPPVGGGLCSLRSGGDSACGAEGGGLPLCGNAYKISVTGFTFSAIWHDKHSADWLAALASPYPAAPDCLHGKACHTILRSLCSLTNRVPLPPHPGDRINHSMLSCRDMAPWLSIHSPTTKWGERWWRQPPKGDCISSPAGRLYGFRRQRRYKKWRRRRRTSPVERYFIPPEGGSPEPVREASADPGQNLWRPGPKARRRHQPSPAKAGVNLREYSLPPILHKNPWFP